MKELRKWYDSNDGRILFVCGAPKVGKSWLISELCRNKQANNIFVVSDVDIYRNAEKLRRIILRLRADEKLSNARIIVESSVVDRIIIEQKIADEEYIKFIQVHPMSLHEYKNIMIRRYNYSDIELVKMYLIIGGLPQCVDYFYRYGDFTGTRNIQQTILEGICTSKDGRKRTILYSLPKQLQPNRTGFKYRQIKQNARQREYGESFQCLERKGIIYRIKYLELGNEIAKINYNVYIYDVGLMSLLTGVDERGVLENENIFMVYDNLLVKNYVIQELYAMNANAKYTINYWHKHRAKAKLPLILRGVGRNVTIPVILNVGKSYTRCIKSFAEQTDVEKICMINLLDKSATLTSVEGIYVYALYLWEFHKILSIL